MKKTTEEDIEKETIKYMGYPMTKDNYFCNARYEVADKEHLKVEVLSVPNYAEWIDMAYRIGIITWRQVGVDSEEELTGKRREIAETLLKDRPISAITESAIIVVKLTNVPRTMTHQIVRHRGFSFQQQSFRVSSCYPNAVRVPENLTDEQRQIFVETVIECRQTYKYLIELGVPMEQARNIMPMGTETSIVITGNLKSWIDYFKARTLDIAQDEHTYIATKIFEKIEKESGSFANIMRNMGVKL